jgi:hypothetical protein
VNTRLQLLITQNTEAQQETNKLLEKISAILISSQLLQECVDHQGNVRESEQIAEIVAESFSAGLCILNELEQRNKDFDYHKSEFFIDKSREG